MIIETVQKVREVLGIEAIYKLVKQGFIRRAENGSVHVDDLVFELLDSGKPSRGEILRRTRGMRRRELERFVRLYNTLFNENLHVSTIYRWRRNSGGHKYQYKEWEKAALRLYLQTNKPTIASVARELQKRFSGLSYYRVYRFLKDYEKRNFDVVIFARNGEWGLRDKVLYYIERDQKLIEPGDVWVADGHVMNLYVERENVRVVVVVWQDWASKRIVGWDIDFTENSLLVLSALAYGILQHGAPRAVYTDRGKAFGARNVKDVFERLGIEHIKALSYNARAKIVERFFRELDEQFSRTFAAYTGSNALKKPADRHKRERLLRWGAKVSRRPLELKVLFDEFERYIKQYNQNRQIEYPTRIGKIELKDIVQLLPSKEARLYRAGIRFQNRFYYADELYGLKTGEKYRIYYANFLFDEIIVEVDTDEYIIAYAEERMHPVAAYLGDSIEQKKLKQKLRKQTAMLHSTARVLRNIFREKQKRVNSKKIEKLIMWECEREDDGTKREN